jgi:hypothetical protein
LYFSLNNTDDIKLTISNVIGQTIATTNFTNLYPGDQSIKYDVSGLSAGLYIFTLSNTNNRIVRKKVVIN